MNRAEKLFWMAALGWPFLAALIKLAYGIALLPFCIVCLLGVGQGLISRDFTQVWQLLGAMAVYFMLSSALYAAFGLPFGGIDFYGTSLQ